MKNETKRQKVLIIALFIIVMILFCIIKDLRKNRTEPTADVTVAKQNIVIVKKQFLPPLTLDNLLIEICKQDIKFPLIVYRQAIKETNWLKCSNCSLDVNNCFGLGWDGHKYFRFDHWTESVARYKLWQERRLKPGDTDYYDFLDRVHYAENMEEYNRTLKLIKI